MNVKYSNRKEAGIIVAGLLLLIGLLTVFLYYNRKAFYPEVKEVTFLKVDMGRDTAVVQAGIRVHNRVPFSFEIDSVSYQIRHKTTKVGWGKQLEQQTLPALKDTVLHFRLFLDKERYRKILAQQQKQNQDSLELDVLTNIYISPPLMKQQKVSINRKLTTAIPKGPSLQIDTFFVKSFSPDAGYTFQLNLNTGNLNLPDLKLENLNYSIRIADSILIRGRVDTAFSINKGVKIVPVLVHVKTSEMVALLQLKLNNKKSWPYEANASAILRTDRGIFENTAVSVTRSGTLDAGKLGSSATAMPTVKQIKSLKLLSKEKNTYLQAELLIHNPTKLPLYLDSARYFVRYNGKVVAQGGNNFEKTLPANGNQRLELPLTVNNKQYSQALSQPQANKEIPLDVDIHFHYNLKGSKPQQITLRKKIMMPVTESPSVKLADIVIRQLDPEKGAHLLVKLNVQNPNSSQLQLDDFKYRLLLKNAIEITGKTQQPIILDSASKVVEIPVHLSGDHISQLAKGLVQGIETWEYAFNGTALVSTPNSLLHQTEISLQTSGVYEIKSKGTPDFMPEISKIDTLAVTIHYDTAWVNMYAAIYNTLPATIHVTQLQVDVIHEKDTIGKSEEKLSLFLVPNANSFAWHTLGLNYGLWEKHVKHHQGEDSILLNLPATLIFDLGNLGKQQVLTDWSTRIPTPVSPVTLLQRLKLRGYNFRKGLKFDALIAVQNANSEGLVVKNIEYRITLENGVDLSGKVNRTYQIPLGVSEVLVPVNLSVLETLKLLKRQLLGPFQLDYKINATAQVSTSNPKLNNVFVIFENHNRSDLKAEKTIKATP